MFYLNTVIDQTTLGSTTSLAVREIALLTRTCGTDYQVQFAFLEQQVSFDFQLETPSRR